MTTEILGFIIIVGAIIVLLARRQLQKAEEDPEVMEASAGRLRYELEQSADEIINRMAGHIDHLESLLREADYKTEMLQQRIDQLQKLQMLQESPVVQSEHSQQPQVQPAVESQTIVESPSVAGPQPAMEVAEAKAEDQDFSQLLESNMQDPNLAVPENVEYTENLPQSYEVSADNMEEAANQPEAEADIGISEEARLALEAIREVSKNLEAAQNDMGLNIDVSSEPEPMMETESDYNTASEYESMPPAAYTTEQEYASESVEPMMEQQPMEPVIEDPEIDDRDDATEIARKLLIAGYTPDDVARFTGLGMNAIALLKQIHKI